MSSEPASSRWPRLLAAAFSGSAFVAVVLLIFLRGGASDAGRPLGTIEDLATLRERDDVNVLFLVIDTLRAERLGAYGYERDTSPVVDDLAAHGLLFDRHLAQSSWTKSSMASLWTGLHPQRTGVTRFDHMIAEEAEMPAEILKEAGFQTIGLYRNGWVSPNFGFAQGFDVYSRPAPGRPPPGIMLENPTIKMGGTDDDVIRAAIEYLRVNGHRRWLLYLHLMDVHEYTYDEESALFGSDYSDIYDNSIRRTDFVVGHLLDYLDRTGLSRKTIIVVGSDHGEAFRERGVEGHARRVFRESTEVPLIISLPFRLEPGIVFEGRTQNVDIWPTVLDILGIRVPSGLDGRSLVEDLLAIGRGGQPAPDAVTAVSHLDQTWGQHGNDPQPSIAVAEGTRRYVLSNEGQEEPTEFLFDSDGDPLEERDHAETDLDEVERLRAVGRAYLEQEPPWGEAPTRDLSEMELNQLRALGYALP